MFTKMLSSRRFYTILLLQSIILFSAVIGIRWEHSVDLNDDYRVLWTINKLPSISQQQLLAHTQQQSYLPHLTEITFEIQVRTLGYIGFGFSPDGQRAGADIVIGWVDHGQTYFHDRHIKRNGDSEPFVDPSQDYVLLLGYENATHTVMRFKRKLDTCDTSHDVPITNDTMRVVYMYHESDPLHGSVVPGSLPNTRKAFKGYKPLSITQRQPQDETMSTVALGSLLASSSSSAASSSLSSSATSAQLTVLPSQSATSKLHVFELLNEDVKLPATETLYWCKVFEFQSSQKQHLVKFEPVFDSKRSKNILQHIILYECQSYGSSSDKLAAMAHEPGRSCYGRPNLPCNAIVAAWIRGSESFTFPPDVGYALDSRYYLMETHYSDMEPPKDLESLHSMPAADNSGLKLYYTSALRKYDAGVLSIGMDPSWRHIIPPLQQKVISEGHCTDDCTKKSFPPQGISIFAVIMQTHNIGKEVKLRQIRKREELLPIVIDRNVHAGYSEYRRLSPPVRVNPGDRLIAECTYNSSQRTAITLGGLTTREESCKAFAVYYPKQHKLTTCHSLPSLPTVLHSLGISELAMDSNPVLILKPAELAGMSLENRLTSYDWQSQFDVFQRVTRNGSFRPICLDARNNMLAGTESIERSSPTLTKYWQQPADTCVHFQHNYKIGEITNVIDTRKNYVAANEGNSEAESMSLSGSRTINTPLTNLALFILALSIMAFAT